MRLCVQYQWMWMAWVIVFLGCGNTDSSGDGTPHAFDQCKFAVVNSDYVSTSISLLHNDGTVCVDHVIHSGSTAPGLLTALSGDVVLPSTPHPEGALVLIDRFPNAAIALVEPTTGTVVQQISVSTGFASNPHDAWFPDGGRMYVTRAESNRTPTERTDDWDEGGDILIVEVDSGQIEDRIDLGSLADEIAGERLDPRPDRLIPLHGSLWTNLRHLSSDFQQAGAGKLVAIDPMDNTVQHSLSLPGLENCGGMQAMTNGLWLVCTGLFAASIESQVAVSGIAYVGVEPGSAPTNNWSMTAVDLGNRPLGFSLAALDEHRAVVVLLGSLQGDGLNDRLAVVDRLDDSVTELDFQSSAYTVGHLYWNAGLEKLLVLNSGKQDPGIQRLKWDDVQGWSSMETVSSNPSVGLPPITLGVLR